VTDSDRLNLQEARDHVSHLLSADPVIRVDGYLLVAPDTLAVLLEATAGHWEYAVVLSVPGEELELGTGGTGWMPEPHLSAQEAQDAWGDGKIMRRWVPDRSPWEPVD
jgi:hypothetical protein